jgi:uncharacterized protein YaaN involved in tellurite resistance
MNTDQSTENKEEALVFSSKENIQQEVGVLEKKEDKLIVSEEIQKDPAVESKAQQYVQQLLDTSIDKAKRRDAVDNFGGRTTEKARHISAMLQQPIKNLKSSTIDGGGPIADGLIELTLQVEELDPLQLTETGGFSRLLGAILFFGKPIKKYFLKFENAQSVIERIIISLDVGRTQLLTDNKILAGDQVKLREMTIQLQKLIQIGQRMDEILAEKLDAEVLEEQEKTFIETELLFPLRQKLQDLHQQLLVNQQGYIAIEIIIRNNRELIRGVQRAKDVTITALQVAVTVALALHNQKIVLDKITALNETTDRLLSSTSQMLATQGVEIQKQASSTMLNMDNLRENFQILRSAVQELTSFRQKALPEMANAIVTMSHLAEEAEEEIKKMEKGDAVRDNVMVFDL